MPIANKKNKLLPPILQNSGENFSILALDRSQNCPRIQPGHLSHRECDGLIITWVCWLIIF